MNQDLLLHLKQILPLSDSELEDFINKFRRVHLKKGEYFIKEGQLKKELGLIIKGCMLCYYNKDGEQVIDEFSLDYEFITDYFSYLTNTPAVKNVKCIEDTDLLVLPFDQLNSEYGNNPDFEKVGRIMAEGLFINTQEKAKSMMIDDAETRYLKLISKRSDLVQRVPQYLIASYLNVKPETLSRIRKKIATK
ncbi:Crp/Fnr family transcriptional regulator [Saccharicrinis sp. FJH2]|uniref:Crp/Fnr family transcriptional regulator n=1 Tax=Saccharicrinis sp. FJH65 TaxID=3344659 RepID=UPI0035F424DB